MRKKGYNVSSVGFHSPIRIELNLMSLRPWRIPLGRLSVVMTNPSIGRSLLGIGREKINLDFKKKGFKSSPYKNPKKGAQFGHPSRSVHQQNFPSQSGNRPAK
jgi:hypothetical protein